MQHDDSYRYHQIDVQADDDYDDDIHTTSIIINQVTTINDFRGYICEIQFFLNRFILEPK